MDQEYYDKVNTFKNLLSDRKNEVQTQLGQWARHSKSFDCEFTPDCPYCILKTELDILNRYSAVLERELGYISHS